MCPAATAQTKMLSHEVLRANVGKYWESQISSKNSNFEICSIFVNKKMYFYGVVFRWTISRNDIKNNPQVLNILRNLEKFQNSIKIHFFIQENAANLKIWIFRTEKKVPKLHKNTFFYSWKCCKFQQSSSSSTSVQKLLYIDLIYIAHVFTNYSKLKGCNKII